MNPATYLPIFMMFLVLFFLLRTKKSAVAKKIIQNKKEKDTTMLELAKRFIGKECLIYAFDNSHQFTGVITEVCDNAILLENNGSTEAVNLDFVIRIREYPKNKNGKKKSIILD